MNKQRGYKGYKPYVFTHCVRKIRFDTPEAAEREAFRLKRTYGASARLVRSYWCEFCEGYHVGRKYDDQ